MAEENQCVPIKEAEVMSECADMEAEHTEENTRTQKWCLYEWQPTFQLTRLGKLVMVLVIPIPVTLWSISSIPYGHTGHTFPVLVQP